MQSLYDINTLITIITFLVVLVIISFLINKKKDLLRSHLKSNNSLNITSNNIIGHGNRITIFEVRNNSYMVVTNRAHISNIISLPTSEQEENKNNGVNND
ncbi:MAG: hypothetical protein CFH34_00649 [Alphaproteobacteria bacterium MarineAlpha9_Bin4]|nr:hypothetical protein [Pelagibacterales bacterium]PPR26889.1 MAG: hypothetical protein CFH34_00649 [Alphaproteobacteria bacterium MarineAlpha9_Bin4]|tara:strand:- start:477 stop:776 length:300 start_codon:yes stop_codon:yes gene_type:complete